MEIVKKFHKPYACSVETLNYAHSKEYIFDIKNKTLSKDGVKKIGFPFTPSRKDNLKSDTTVLCNMIHKNQIELRKSVTLKPCVIKLHHLNQHHFFSAPSKVLFANFV